MLATPMHDQANHDLLRMVPDAVRRVVEVGCSSGATGAAFLGAHPQCEYIGIEIVPEYAQAARARVTEVLERLGLAHRAQHHPSQLSGGQQQRVAIARAIAARPALLLADEPTGNLDSAHGQEVMRLLRELNDEGTTLVMVTHSAEHAALASRTVRLLDGRVLVDAHAEHLA